MKLHRNVNTSLSRLSKFIFTEWKFAAVKTDELHRSLKDNDKDAYGLDISDLVWPVYFDDLTLGARVYLSKDPEKTLPFARKKNSM